MPVDNLDKAPPALDRGWTMDTYEGLYSWAVWIADDD